MAQAVEELDATIGQILATIFDLHEAAANTGLRSRITAVVEELAPVVGTYFELALSRPLDTLVDSGLVTESRLSFGKPSPTRLVTRRHRHSA